jgi:hypothetical protein
LPDKKEDPMPPTRREFIQSSVTATLAGLMIPGLAMGLPKGAVRNRSALYTDGRRHEVEFLYHDAVHILALRIDGSWYFSNGTRSAGPPQIHVPRRTLIFDGGMLEVSSSGVYAIPIHRSANIRYYFYVETPSNGGRHLMELWTRSSGVYELRFDGKTIL